MVLALIIHVNETAHLVGLFANITMHVRKLISDKLLTNQLIEQVEISDLSVFF